MSHFPKMVVALAIAGLMAAGNVQAAAADDVEVSVKLIPLPGAYATAVVTIRDNSVNAFGTQADIVTYQSGRRLKTTFTAIPSTVHLVDKDTRPHWFTSLRPGQARRAVFGVKYNDQQRFCFEVRTTNMIVGKQAGGTAKGQDCLAADK